MALEKALSFRVGAKANALALSKACTVELEDPSAIASLAIKTLGKGPKHKAPINDDTVKLVTVAFNILQRASAICDKYEFSEGIRQACDDALRKVETQVQPGGPCGAEAPLGREVRKARGSQTCSCAKNRECAERPSQEEPEPEGSEGEEEEEDEREEPGSDAVDDSDGHENPDSSFDL